MKDDLFRFLKGFAMGAANVIPGVSGGTIAFITGIYERLIDALKRFDATTVRLALKFRLREVWERIDGHFLAALGLGVAVGIALPARFLKWGFDNHPVLVWAFFFGLIAASLPAVGKLVRRWSARPLLALVVGVAIAVSMAFLTPASENDHPAYLLLCGVVAMCSMIIPGLSGSFVLLLLGNYRLVMIESVTALSDGRLGEALPVLVPVGLGAVIGMLALARLLSWLFHHWHDLAVALITGFIGGSLLIIWPWKDEVPVRNAEGLIVVKTAERVLEPRPGSLAEVRQAKAQDEEVVTAGYENWRLPNLAQLSTWAALGALAAGVVLILLVEKAGARPGRSKDQPSAA